MITELHRRAKWLQDGETSLVGREMASFVKHTCSRDSLMFARKNSL